MKGLDKQILAIKDTCRCLIMFVYGGLVEKRRQMSQFSSKQTFCNNLLLQFFVTCHLCNDCDLH